MDVGSWQRRLLNVIYTNETIYIPIIIYSMHHNFLSVGNFWGDSIQFLVHYWTVVPVTFNLQLKKQKKKKKLSSDEWGWMLDVGCFRCRWSINIPISVE